MRSRSRFRFVSCGLLVGAGACAPAPDVTIPEVALEPKQNASSAPVERPKPKRSFESNVAVALCRDRVPCSIVGLDPIAADSTIFVATLHLGAKGKTTAVAEPAFSRNGDAWEFPSTFGDCQRFEVWRVERAAEDAAAGTKKLFDICNDGHGAAGLGEDHFVTREGVLTREISGGSSWRWWRKTEVTLDPLRLVKEASSGHWSLGDNTSEETWDWETLRGREMWETTRCTATPGPSGPPMFARVLVPDLTLPAEFVESGWKTTSHADCAAKVDGEASGYAIEGRGDPRSARLSVVMSSGNHLFVEAFDDVRTKKGAKVADSIVIHFAEDAPTYMDHCLGDPVAPDKIEVPLDGKVKRTGSSAKSATVESAPPADASGPFRVHVHFAKPVPYFTVEYRDSDDGKRVARAIATSAFEPGDSATLGANRPIQSRQLHCVQRDGKLEVERSGKLDPERPFIE